MVALGVGRQAQAAEPCDRACLEGFVNQYLDALAAHDSSKLPLTENARYTENGQTLKLNDGMWGPRVTLGSKLSNWTCAGATMDRNTAVMTPLRATLFHMRRNQL